MSRKLVVATVLLAGLGWAVWPAAEAEKEAPEEAASDARPEDKPTEAEARAKKLARVAKMLKRKRSTTRPVTVRVVGCGLLPASGAEVGIAQAEGAVAAVGVADGVGRLDVRVPKGETVTFVATHGGFTGASSPSAPKLADAPDAALESDADEEAAAPEPDIVDVNVCPGATVLGVVLDDGGNPVPGVEVAFESQQDVAVTDEEGRFLLTDLFLTSARVLAKAPDGRGSADIADLEPEEERELTITLERGRRVLGWVITDADEPVARATVVALNGEGETVAQARTDRSGRFWLKKVPFEGVRLVAESAIGWSREVPVGPEEGMSHDDGVILVVEPTAELELVADASAAIGEFVVVDASRPGAQVLAHIPGAEGELRVPAPARVAVYHTGFGGGEQFLCGEARLEAGDRKKVTCTLDDARGATLVGQLVDATGLAVPGARVDVRISGGMANGTGASTVSDANGRFSLTLPMGGVAALRATLVDDLEGGRWTSFVRRRNISALVGETTDLGRLTMLDVRELREEFRPGPFGGIGASIQESSAGIAFRRVVAGGPLDLAGVNSGDVLLAIGDRRVDQESVTEIARQLRGEAGTSVELLLWRNGQEERVTVERATIDVQASGWR